MLQIRVIHVLLNLHLDVHSHPRWAGFIFFVSIWFGWEDGPELAASPAAEKLVYRYWFLRRNKGFLQCRTAPNSLRLKEAKRISMGPKDQNVSQ